MRAAILACGNPSRGDDALAVRLAERLEGWTPPDGVTLHLVCEMQWQVEHALDLRGADVVLFVDAHASTPAPISLRAVSPNRDSSYTSHELSPEAVLHVAERINPGPLPPVWELGIRGHAWDLGAPMSPGAEANLEVAWELVTELLSTPPAEWSAASSSGFTSSRSRCR